MTYDTFSICFGSLHFPKIQSDETWKCLSPNSISLLDSLYESLMRKLNSARNPQRVEGWLKGSIFCCCLSEGMAILLCSPDARNGSIKLDGFIVMKESLRTAWRMVRWKLLFVCAGGWNYTGIQQIPISEVERMARSLQASQEYQKKLVAVGQEMLSSETPFSFAMTDCPLNFLSLNFKRVAVNSAKLEENVDDATAIPVYKPFVDEQVKKYSKSIGFFSPSIRLHYGSKRQYFTQRVESIGAHEDIKQLKGDIKEILKDYPSNDVWYFSVEYGDYIYLNLLSINTTFKLMNNGYVPFSEIHQEMNRFIKSMNNFVEQSEDARYSEDEKERETGEEKPKKKKGLFDFMKKDKK